MSFEAVHMLCEQITETKNVLFGQNIYICVTKDKTIFETFPTHAGV